MFPPWFLISILFTPAQAFSISRLLPTDGLGSLENPTCEELREFWRQLKQAINVDATETNEISVMPPKLLDRIQMEISRNGKHSKTHTIYPKDVLSNRFSKDFWVMQNPVLPNSLLLPKSQIPSEPEGIGIFGDFHEQLDQSIPSNHQRINLGPVSPPSAVLGDQKYAEREYFVPQWGSPEEVGTFGSFVDVDVASPHLARTPKDTTAEWADLPFPVKCDVLMNSDCKVNEQCLCKEGWKRMQCIHGKCMNYNQNDDNLENFGTWHDGPIPQLQLRLQAMPRAKGYRSIFM